MGAKAALDAVVRDLDVLYPQIAGLVRQPTRQDLVTTSASARGATCAVCGGVC